MTSIRNGVPLISLIYLAGHLAVAVVTDLDRRRIPNRLVLSLAAGGAVTAVWKACARVGLGPVLDCLSGALLALTSLWGLSLLFSGGIGGGDIKLMAASGLYLGAAGTIRALIWTFLSGGILSLLMLCFGLSRLKEKIPYAPAVALGVLAAAVQGI
ncbi:MAG: prepilin peptidase [Bacillota bacterium]|nr:prepilin peptidase [Candidatus Fermentithermobacillaceae bacterium]